MGSIFVSKCVKVSGNISYVHHEWPAAGKLSLLEAWAILARESAALLTALQQRQLVRQCRARLAMVRATGAGHAHRRIEWRRGARAAQLHQVLSDDGVTVPRW